MTPQDKARIEAAKTLEEISGAKRVIAARLDAEKAPPRAFDALNLACLKATLAMGAE